MFIADKIKISKKTENIAVFTLIMLYLLVYLYRLFVLKSSVVTIDFKSSVLYKVFLKFYLPWKEFNFMTIIKERNIFMFILLSIVTCGIYPLYFYYKLAEDMNIVCDGDGERTTEYIIAFLLSIITCGFYMFYWFYKIGNRLQANAPRYGLSFQENGTTVLLWLILGSLLCGIGAFIGINIIIKNINALGERYNSNAAAYYKNNTQQ